MIESQLKQVMQAKGISIRKLAEQTGLAQETIKRARRGLIAQSQLDTLIRIAVALGVQVSDLYEIHDE